MWLVTFCEPGGAYETSVATLVEACDADTAADAGLATILHELPDETCGHCESGICGHVHAMPYDDVVSYDVRSRPVRRDGARP